MRGVRTLAMMMFQTASTSSPPSTIFSGGMRSPSWNTSVASPAKPPGTLPPTSVMCPMQATNPASWSLWKTGLITQYSGRWQPPRKGSL